MGIEPDSLSISRGDQANNHIDSADMKGEVKRSPKHVLRKPLPLPGHVHHDTRTVEIVVTHDTGKATVQHVPDTPQIGGGDKTNT